jgi:hypothetical protein
MAPLFPSFSLLLLLLLVFIHCEGKRKASRDKGFGTSLFSFYYPRKSLARFDYLLRCSHKTNIACDFASIDSFV